MRYVVVVVFDSDRQPIEVYDAGTDSVQAERVRCRIHFDARPRSASVRGPRTYVKPVMEEPR